jgi:hypothetical protein
MLKNIMQLQFNIGTVFRTYFYEDFYILGNNGILTV